jgi:hypothetical protein
MLHLYNVGHTTLMLLTVIALISCKRPLLNLQIRIRSYESVPSSSVEPLERT